MAPLNPEAPEFSPVPTSSLPCSFSNLSISIPSYSPSLPCCFPVLPCLESRPPSLPCMEVCPPRFSIHNNNVNVYYTGGFPWPDPLLKSPFHDPSWYSLGATPAAQAPLPLSVLPQAEADASVVEEQETKEGEVEVVAPRRTVVHRAARKIARTIQNQWRRIERFQCSEQAKGKQSWRPKHGSGESCNSEQGEEQKHTTLMIRNIPNKFTRKMFLEDLDKHCVELNEKLSKEVDDSNGDFLAYDFVYLPFDFRTRCNRGYAFVNLTSPAAACRLEAVYHGRKWNAFGSKKTCAVDFAHTQGKEALEERFKRTTFPCDSDDFLPIVFSPSRNGSSVFVASNVGRRGSLGIGGEKETASACPE